MDFTQKNTNCESCDFKSHAVLVLNSDELSIISNNCVEVKFKKGEMLFKQHSFSSHVIFIKSGLVKIHMSGPGGKDQILKVQQAPSYLGLANLFGDKINHYSATCIEESTACFIHIDEFKGLIKTNGDFAYEIIKEISREELKYYNRFVNRNQKQINGRLAETLLNFTDNIYKNNIFYLPLNRNDLSAIICASRESTIRELQSFANSGIIELKGKQVTILDKNRLEQISKNG